MDTRSYSTARDGLRATRAAGRDHLGADHLQHDAVRAALQAGTQTRHCCWVIDGTGSKPHAHSASVGPDFKAIPSVLLVTIHAAARNPRLPVRGNDAPSNHGRTNAQPP